MENQQILDYVKSQCRSKRNFSGEEEFRVLKKGCDIDIFMTEVIATYRDQGKGAFSQKVGRATNKDYIQFRCERSAKPTGKKKGPTATRANSCGAYVSFKFFEGASWKACQIRLIAEHNGHSFAPEEGKVNNIDSELVSYIEYLSLQGQTVSDIIVKVGEWSKGRGHNDMRDRRFFPTPEDIAYHRRRTLAKTRLDANDASSVQKMCQGTIKDDILFFQNLSEAHQQPLIIVIQTNFMKDQLEKFGQNSTIFVDASYRGITSYGYAFYAVIARNDHGHGVPVAYVLTSKEDVQTLTLAFNKIKDASRANHQFIPRTIMVDKDATEIAVLRSVWPTAVIHLCWFHVLQAVHRWLVRTAGGGLSGPNKSDQRKQVIKAMHVLKFCSTKAEFDAKVETQMEELDKLLGSNTVSSYLRREWITCADMWSNFGRRMFHQFSNTNNLVERFFCRLKYEFLKGMVNRRVDDLLRLLTGNVTNYFRYLDGLAEAGRVQNKFQMRKDSHKENACEMVNQGLERHFVHVGKGICRVPSQSKPGTLTFNVDVVHQTCDSFPCCGVRCKHIHFAEMVLLKSGTTPARLIEDFSVSVSYFHNEGDSLLTVLANDDSDNHSPEVYDIQREACSCTTASFGLKCVAQYCWERIHARAQDQPPSIPAEGPQDDPGEPPDDHAADVEVEARPGTSSDQRKGKMSAMIDEIFQWKNSEEFACRPDIYQNVLELHGDVDSNAPGPH